MTASRRDFLKTIGGATVCACTGLTGANGCAMLRGVSRTAAIRPEAYTLDHGKLTIALDRCPCLAASGGSGKLSIDTGDSKPMKMIVLHVKEGQYQAFTDRCTHGGRELNFLPGQEKLQCSSFGRSTFDLQGQVLKGPAKEPLTGYPVEKRDNTLILTIAT